MGSHEIFFVNFSRLRMLLKNIGQKNENWEQMLLEAASESNENVDQLEHRSSTMLDAANNKLTNDIFCMPCEDSLLLLREKDVSLANNWEFRSPKLAGLNLEDSGVLWTSAMETQKGLLQDKTSLNTALAPALSSDVMVYKSCTAKVSDFGHDSPTTVVGNSTPQKPINDALSLFFTSPTIGSLKLQKKPPKNKAVKRKRSPEHELDGIECFSMPDTSTTFSDRNEPSFLSKETSMSLHAGSRDVGNVTDNDSILESNIIRKEEVKKDHGIKSLESLNNSALTSVLDKAFSPTFGNMRTSTPLRPDRFHRPFSKRIKIADPRAKQCVPSVSPKLSRGTLTHPSIMGNGGCAAEEWNSRIDDISSILPQERKPGHFYYPNRAQIKYFMVENTICHDNDLMDIPTNSIEHWSAEDKAKLKKYAELALPSEGSKHRNIPISEHADTVIDEGAVSSNVLDQLSTSAVSRNYVTKELQSFDAICKKNSFIYKDNIRSAGTDEDNDVSNQPSLTTCLNSDADLFRTVIFKQDLGELSIANVQHQKSKDSILTMSQSFLWKEASEDINKKVYIEKKLNINWSSVVTSDVKGHQLRDPVQNLIAMEVLKNIQSNMSPILDDSCQGHSMPSNTYPSEFSRQLAIEACDKSILSKNAVLACLENVDKNHIKSTNLSKQASRIPEDSNITNNEKHDDKENQRSGLEKFNACRPALDEEIGLKTLRPDINFNEDNARKDSFPTWPVGIEEIGRNSASFCGFKTAAGKEIVVNSDNLEVAKALLSKTADEEFESILKLDNREESSSSITEFLVGGEITISEAASKRTKHMLDSTVDNLANIPRKYIESFTKNSENLPKSDASAQSFFCTGSGKSVKISKDSLTNALKLLDRVDSGKGQSDEVNDSVDPQKSKPPSTFSFFTSRGKPVAVSKESLMNAQKILEDAETPDHDRIPSRVLEVKASNYSCFSTGGGKPVGVSKNAYEQAQQILSTENDSVLDKPKEKSLHGSMLSDKGQKVANVNGDEVENCGTEVSKLEIPYKKVVTIKANAMANDEKSNRRDSLALKRQDQAFVIKSKLKNKKMISMLGTLSTLRSDSRVRISFQQAVRNKLPMSHGIDDLLDNGVMPNTMHVSSLNAKEFKFNVSEMNKGDDIGVFMTTDGGVVIADERNQIGEKEFHMALLAAPGISPEAVDKRWTCNHYKWIVWKLASMEMSFPLEFGGRCLTVDNVFSQLRYRYDVEVVLSRRSALKKIFERDDTPKRGLVLCVADLRNKEDTGSTHSLILTDGWYGIPALLDGFLNSLVIKGKIKIGTKLAVFGSELIGPESACTPLDAPEGIFLKLHGNSTRRAKWHSKLGFVYNCIPKFSLSSLSEAGGNVVCLDLLVVRSYPLLFYEKYPNGTKGTVRSARLEKKFASEFESKRQMYAEKFYERCEKEFQERLSKSRHCMASGEGESQGDSEGYPTNSEQSLSDFVKSRMEHERNTIPSRNITPLLKVRMAGCHQNDLSSKRAAILSIWNPSEEIVGMMKEGSRLLVYNVMASSEKLDDALTLNSNRSTQFKKVKVDDNIQRLVFEPRKVSRLKCLHSDGIGGDECDLIVLIVKIMAKNQVNHSFAGFAETIVIADEEGTQGVIIFQGGLAAHGVEGIIKEGNIVACCNLKLIGANCSRKNNLGSGLNVSTLPGMVAFKAFELSEFSCRPTQKYLEDAVESYKKLLNSDKSLLSNYQQCLEGLLKGSEMRSCKLVRTQSGSTSKKLNDFDKKFSSILCFDTSSSSVLSKSAEEESISNPPVVKARPSGLRKTKVAAAGTQAGTNDLQMKELLEDQMDYSGFSEEWDS